MSCPGCRGVRGLRVGVRMTSARRGYHSAPAASPSASAATQPFNEQTVTITDDLIFRWAKIVQIARIFPVMHAVRALEYTIATNDCRTCRKAEQPKTDRSLLQEVRRMLGTCTDEQARLVKEAARITMYRVQFLDLAGVPQDAER